MGSRSIRAVRGGGVGKEQCPPRKAVQHYLAPRERKCECERG